MGDVPIDLWIITLASVGTMLVLVAAVVEEVLHGWKRWRRRRKRDEARMQASAARFERQESRRW